MKVPVDRCVENGVRQLYFSQRGLWVDVLCIQVLYLNKWCSGWDCPTGSVWGSHVLPVFSGFPLGSVVPSHHLWLTAHSKWPIGVNVGLSVCQPVMKCGAVDVS